MNETEATPSDRSGPISSTEVVPAVLGRKAFHCLTCGVYASQEWRAVYERAESGIIESNEVGKGVCLNCSAVTLWLKRGSENSFGEFPDAVLLWPKNSSSAPRHHEDMPTDVTGDYEEARDIVERSPRGAVALLRLAVQKLMVALGQPGKNINDDIAALVKGGLPVEVQQALDALRVVGNNAVHPGELDLKDDRDTAIALFGLVNFIVEQRIAQPQKLAKLYASLPAGAVAAIQKRDGGGS